MRSQKAHGLREPISRRVKGDGGLRLEGGDGGYVRLEGLYGEQERGAYVMLFCSGSESALGNVISSPSSPKPRWESLEVYVHEI